MRAVCFVGDSMVQGWDDPAERAWPARLVAAERARGNRLEGFNLGGAGETSRAISGRWRREAAERLGRWLAEDRTSAGLVFAFGLDDMADHGAEGIRVALPEALATAEAIVAEASAWAPTLWIGPPPLALLPRPVVRPDGSAYPAERSEALSLAYRHIARGLGVSYLDLHSLLRHWVPWRRAVARWQAGRPAPELQGMLAGAVLGWEGWTRWWGRDPDDAAGPGARAAFQPLRVEGGRLA